MPTQAEIEEKRRRDWAANDALPHVSDLPNQRDPSGLVPYPCEHGVPVKPARYPHTRNAGVWLDDDGNERPPYGGKSWGRAKYLHIVAFGGRTTTDGHGKEWFSPFAQILCTVCRGDPVPADFYTTADGFELEH